MSQAGRFEIEINTRYRGFKMLAQMCSEPRQGNFIYLETNSSAFIFPCRTYIVYFDLINAGKYFLETLEQLEKLIFPKKEINKSKATFHF